MVIQKIMYYFAYGSNMFTYRLEKRVGKVLVLGIAKLPLHQFQCNKLSIDGSLKADACYTGREDDFVFGVVFDINPASKSLLDKAEGLGKGYRNKDVTVEMIDSGKALDMFTYVTEKPEDINQNAPFDWYMELIVAGADEHHLDAEYKEKLKSIKTRKDELLGRRDTSLFILKESLLPRKNLYNALNSIDDAGKSREFKISVNDHILNEQILYFKGEPDFAFETTSPIQKGIDTNRELDLRDKTINLESGDLKWVVKGRDFLIDSVNYDFENSLKLLTGRVNSFSTYRLLESKELYFRFVMPLTEKLKNYRDYESKGYTENYKLILGGLIEIDIDDKRYHFYSFTKDKISYAVIDCLNKTKLSNIQRACHCIFLTSAFLSGTTNSRHGNFICYDNSDMQFPLGMSYYSFGDVGGNLMPVFTTNPYTGIKPEELERTESGMIEEKERKKLYEGMIFFPQKVFSNICNLAFLNDKVLRSLLLWTTNQSASLELKLGVQYILLETIAGAIVKGGNTELKPIPDNRLAEELIQNLVDVANKFSEENGIPKEELVPLIKRITASNAPPNADKLKKAFDQVGYILSEEEKEVLKKRNTFLHGSVPSLGDVDLDFKDLFHLSLRLHFLIAALILKYSSFEGKIINYAKIHEGITGKFLNEERLKKI